MTDRHSAPYLYQQLKQQFGFDTFRDGQLEAIQQVIQGQSTLAIFPTGSGKSLCYQLSAINLPHLTLVISPLLALIQDQLIFLKSTGINAASIDSSLNQQEIQSVMHSVKQGECKILMVSVERFKNERFRQFLSQVTISQLVVDEAHCISEWGHNFRPDYLKIPQICQTFSIPQVLLLTATATKKVKLDMCDRFGIKAQHVIQTGFYRNNLNLQVVPVAKLDKSQQLTCQIQALFGSGIVYVTLQQTAEQVASTLISNGINARAYHAGMDSQARQSIQQQFMSNQIQVIVATIAFGMGIDKSDIRFVIHYDLPKSIENYSQEIGRAGRDGQASTCITLANLDGLNTIENFVYADTPDLQDIEKLLNIIQTETDETGKWEMQELALSKACNIKTLPLKTLLVQLELQGVIQPTFAYFADFKYQLLIGKQDLLARFDPSRAAFIQKIFDHTQFKKIWGQLDFDGLHQATNEPRARVVAALEYLAEQELIILETKKMTQVFYVNMTAIVEVSIASQMHTYFKDKETKEILRIAQLVRFFELGKCLSRNLACYFDDMNAPIECHHCSVCDGSVAKLPVTQTSQKIDKNQLSQFITELAQQVKVKNITITHSTLIKFLAGMSVPILARLKVKNLAGYGALSEWRYQEIVNVVNTLEDK